MPTSPRSAFDQYLEGLVQQVKADVLSGVARTIGEAASKAATRTRRAATDGAVAALPGATGTIVVLDKRVRLDREAEIAAVVGRRGVAEPEVGSARVPAGKYRVVTVFVPEE